MILLFSVVISVHYLKQVRYRVCLLNTMNSASVSTIFTAFGSKSTYAESRCHQSAASLQSTVSSTVSSLIAIPTQLVQQFKSLKSLKSF